MPHADVSLGPVGTQEFSSPHAQGAVTVTARGTLTVLPSLRAVAGEVTHLDVEVTGGWDGGLDHRIPVKLPLPAARALFAALGEALDDMPAPWSDEEDTADQSTPPAPPVLELPTADHLLVLDWRTATITTPSGDVPVQEETEELKETGSAAYRALSAILLDRLHRNRSTHSTTIRVHEMGGTTRASVRHAAVPFTLPTTTP